MDETPGTYQIHRPSDNTVRLVFRQQVPLVGDRSVRLSMESKY